MRKSLLTDSASDEASELQRNVLNEGKRSEPERSESERSGWNERDGAEALLRGDNVFYIGLPNFAYLYC